jgi:hypothetical protein
MATLNLAVEIFTTDTKAWQSKHAILSPWVMHAIKHFRRQLLLCAYFHFSQALSFSQFTFFAMMAFIPKQI